MGKASRKFNKRELDRMVEDATVDAYNEYEQINGLFCAIEQELVVPFSIEVLGVAARVEMVDLSDEEDIVAICRNGRHKQTISLRHLETPDPPPEGWAWVEAYRHWAKGWPIPDKWER